MSSTSRHAALRTAVATAHRIVQIGQAKSQAGVERTRSRSDTCFPCTTTRSRNRCSFNRSVRFAGVVLMQAGKATDLNGLVR